MTHELFAEEFAEMAVRLHDEPTVEETVERVLEYALKAVDCDYAGVTFLHGAMKVDTAASTDPLVQRIEKLQLETGEGPALEALAHRLHVVVDDTLTELRWPRWAERVAEAGVRSVLSTRLSTEESVVGTLNLYAAEPGRFDDDDCEVAHVLARHAAVALATAQKVENLWQAVDARKLIGQAQGILMERFDLKAEQAFAVLLRYSQNHNLKLRAVAERLVETRTLPGGTD